MSGYGRDWPVDHNLSVRTETSGPGGCFLVIALSLRRLLSWRGQDHGEQRYSWEFAKPGQHSR
jgi:hypothetical protein